MAEIGMDSDAVRGIATQLAGQAQQLSSIAGMVDRVVAQLDAVWEGGDASEFIAWWRGKHRPALMASVQSLEGLATSARNNASAQDTTSSAAGSTASRSGWDVFARADGAWEWIDNSFYAVTLGLLIKSGLIRGMPAAEFFTKDAGVAFRTFDDAFPLLRSVDKAFGPIGLAFQSVDLVKDFVDHASGTEKAWDIAMFSGQGYGVAGLFIEDLPFAGPVGLVVGAAGLGVFAGTEITKIPAVHRELDQVEDSVVDEGWKSVGGAGIQGDSMAAQNARVEASDRLVKRYSGWSGPLHAGEDWVKNIF